MVSYRKIIESPTAWVGPKIQNDLTWILNLEEWAISEVDDALRNAIKNNIKIPFDKSSFDLPRLGLLLDQVLNEVENGRGFQMIRGIPRNLYSDAECAIIYWGICNYLGSGVAQNSYGHYIVHVRDEGSIFSDHRVRGYLNRKKMDFHTDLLPVDVLGLFCLRRARCGGTSKVVSALTIHNILLSENPDLLDTLYSIYTMDWRGEEPTGEQLWYRLPMFSEKDGNVTSRIVTRSHCETCARFGEEYRLSDAQREALDLVQEIANRPELMLTLEFQEGDMQFINNHTLLHAREEYEDYDDPAMKRNLMRMWIAVNESRRRPLHHSLAERYKIVLNGGIPKKIPNDPALVP